MSSKVLVAETALAVTALTAAYAAGWETAFVAVGDAKKVRFLLTLVKADATTLEYRLVVEDETGTTDYIELDADGSVERALTLANVPDPVSLSVQYDVTDARRVKLQAKITGGAGAPTMAADVIFGG